MKLRSALIIILGFALVGILLYSQRDSLAPRSQETLPLDLNNLLTTEWKVLSDGITACDYDADGAQEWLVLYEYDHTPLEKRFLIGGVIFDTQSSSGHQSDGTPSLYRPELLIPYRLLPDIYPGKGQGYLGENRVSLSLYSKTSADQNSTCSADEIVVLGYNDGSVEAAPSRLSVFHWQGMEQGSYQVAHFVGNARVETTPADLPARTDQPVTAVKTFNRLNERSQLCEVRAYQRMQPLADLSFREVADEYSIDFCYEAPQEPAYPEGVVMAALRGYGPAASSPTGSGYFAPGATDTLPASLSGMTGDSKTTFQVLSYSTQGTVTPSGGDQITVGGSSWWVGREQAGVTTQLQIGGASASYIWHLVSYTNGRVSTDIRWRIASIAAAG